MTDKMLRKALERIDSMPRSEFRRLVQKRIEHGELLEELLETGQLGQAVMKDGRLLYANTLFMTLLPTNRKFLGRCEGRLVDEVLTDPEVLEYVKGLDVHCDGLVKEFYFQQGSEVRIIELSCRVLDGGRIDLVVEDVTQRERERARLRRSESLASMTTMAAGIAHEIKNPLAAMQIHIQLLNKAFDRKKTLTKADAERYLSVLQEEIEHLNGIAVDFLFAVRPMNVKLRKTRIEEVIKALEDFVRPELEDHGIRLVVKVEPFLPQLELDASYLRQALLNLVKNSESAMENGGRLDIEVFSDGDFVRIAVRDTGCGIDQEHLAKIFEPYFTTKASGTGLGLTVAYKIVKEHGGDMGVESTVGQGTCFTISLPVPSDERTALEESNG